jgi:myo-inositol-1(or 4)-monophosphatase
MSQNKKNNYIYKENEIDIFINTLLDKISVESLNFFNSELDIKNKGIDNFDPVTNADIEIEKTIRNEIKKEFPNVSIYGEELDSKLREDETYFVIDPIDGTKSFISGIPTWSTLIGFIIEKKPTIGFADYPALKERYIGITNGSFLIKNKSKKKISTSNKSILKDCVLSATDPITMFKDNFNLFKKVEDAVSLSRYGLDSYAYCLLASGLIDIIVESELKIYDIQPLVPIIRSAGGYIATWEGDEHILGGRVIAAANKDLFLQTQKVLLG